MKQFFYERSYTVSQIICFTTLSSIKYAGIGVTIAYQSMKYQLGCICL